MRSKISFSALGLAAFLLFASPVALAQSDVYVAAKPPMDGSYLALGYNVAPTIQEAVNRAMASASAVYAAYSQYAVYVDWNLGIPWVESVSIYADADFTIQGVTAPLTGLTAPPQDVVIQSPNASLPVMEIIPALDSTRPVNKLVVEGLTLTGGSAGFHVKSGAAPTLNRLYIIGNAGSGVLCEDGSDTLLVNCSIVRNPGHGVEVGSNSFAKVVFCTVYDNGLGGVYVDSSVAGGSDGEVYNSIIYQNARSGLEWTTPGTPVLISNDVYDNGSAGPTADPDNYVNVTDWGGSLREDPLLWPDGGADPTPWVGALLTSQCIYGIYGVYDVYNAATSPVIDMADDTVEILPFTAEDFEGQFRPTPFLGADQLPDMGADEVVRCGVGGDLAVWYRCVITPDPVGKLDAGELIVEIGLTHAAAVTPVLYMVPQGGSEINPLHWITFTMTGSDGLGSYTYENDVDIDPADFTALNNVIDGHAILYLAVDDYTYGVTDTARIQGQAITGRHTIIDTTPPRMVAPVFPGGLTAGDIVAVLNTDPEMTATAGAGTVGVEFVSGLQAGHPPEVAALGFPGTYLPALAPAPVMVPGVGTDDGRISQDVYVGEGAQIFVNAGSISNLIAPDNLDIRMTVRFEDPQPLDSAGDPVTGRVVSGFPASDTDVTTGPSNTISQWDFPVGGGLFATAEATCIYTTSGDNFGFDPNSPGGPGDVSFNYQNAETEGVWTFVEQVGPYAGLNGLGWDKAAANGQTMVRFRAKDRAGNVTELDQLLEPLQIWWLLQSRSRIIPNQEGQTVGTTTFNVAMSSFQNPNVTLELRPVFTHRFYTSTALAGPFSPATGWAPWTESNVITLPSDFGGQWVLLVTLAADEAGNVELWPWDYTAIDWNLPTGLPAGVGTNWMRFRVGVGGLDTSITPSFWHDRLGVGQGTPEQGEPNFGAQSILPSPQNTAAEFVAGLFRITLISNSASPDLGVRWTLTRGDGLLVYSDMGVPASGNIVTAAVPPASFNPIDPEQRLEDIEAPRQARNWVFSATTFLDYNPSDPAAATNRNGVWDAGEPIDQTPASFAFTVVPQTSLDAYVRNRESMDRQPIKVQEER